VEAVESTTALVVTASHEARVAPADDGKAHIEYDLIALNEFATPMTLTSVAVLDASSGKELMKLEGNALSAVTESAFDQQPLAAIPPSGSAAVLIDLAVPLGQVPAHLTHRIIYTVAESPMTALIGSYEVDGPAVSVDTRPAITILPPLVGKGWGSFNGCCLPNKHRSLRVGAGTRIATPEVFAVDWIQVDDQGRFYSGDGTKVGDYPSYGAQVRSVADGEVVEVHDGMDESIPFQRPALRVPEDFGGNYVVVRIRPDVYAVYAHLQRNSIEVKVGSQVAAGAPIGKLGNTGNSSSPHLHFGLLDGANIVSANSVPFVFAKFHMRAQITGGDDKTIVITPDSREVSNAYPLFPGIADFDQ
jgi:hypothetical protein